MTASYLGNKYELHMSHNYEEYMEAVGVDGLVARRIVDDTPTVQLTENNGVYSLKTFSDFKNHEIKFRLGEEFDQETIDGRRVKAKITRHGNIFTEVQKQANRPVTYISRKFTPMEVIDITRLDNIVSCSRVYRLQE